MSAAKNPKMFRLNFYGSVVAALFCTFGAVIQMWELIQMFGFLNR